MSAAKGNNLNLYDCDIYVYNTAQGVSSAIVGIDNYMQNCSFHNYGGAQYTNNTIDGNYAKIINCKFETLGGSVYPISSEGAFVQGCYIAVVGTSTVQIQCNSKNNCTFFNCTLDISGRGTLRCNSGSGCFFINCTLNSNSTDSGSYITANDGSNCYFLNCKLTTTGKYYGVDGVSADRGFNCFFIGCILTAKNTNTNGYAYGSKVWGGVMIGSDIFAYVPEGGTGEAIGYLLNSTVTNKCIIIGCRFRQVAVSGYVQGASIVIDGTSTGGQYMITNNYISGDIRTHTATGSNYVKEPNITGGTW